MEELRNIELSTYPIFSLKGYITEAKLLSNYDGDTADIIIFYKGIPMHLKARFYGYDCSEMKPSIKCPNRDEKKKKAIEAKKRLWYLCTNQEEEKSHKTLIKIKCGEFDKYGRLLVTVFYEGVNVNLDLISKGYAIAYNGGTKEVFEQ